MSAVRKYDRLGRSVVTAPVDRCTCCQRVAAVFAQSRCLRCFELAEAKQMAKTAAEMAHVLVVR